MKNQSELFRLFRLVMKLLKKKVKTMKSCRNDGQVCVRVSKIISEHVKACFLTVSNLRRASLS